MLSRGQTSSPRSPASAVVATVVATDARAIDEAIAEADREGADAAEVRLDAAPSLDPASFGTEARIPLLASCRARRDGGRFDGGEDDRVRLLERAARTGRFLLDVERGSDAERLAREPRGRVAVLSHHDTETMPRDLEQRARDLLGALAPGQMAKLVPTAQRATDVLAVKSLLRSLRTAPLAAFAMGEAGRASRILCGAWGSTAVWAAARRDAPGAPGQLDLGSLLRLYRFREIGAETRVFAVAGAPVSGSLSPAIHNAAFARLGIDAVYVALECRTAEELAALAGGLPLAGISITSPLKIAVLPLAAEPDETVRDAGACNTIVGRRGYNTDGEAALEDVRARIDPRGRAVTVVGAGGAARAVAFALARAGARLTIATREAREGFAPDEAGEGGDRRGTEAASRVSTRRAGGEAPAGESPPGKHRSKGEALARELGASFCRIRDLAGDPEAILVQATSASLEDPVVPETALRYAYILDLRYTPRGAGPGSGLVAAARRAGIPADDGLGMLVRQAAAQVRLFTGCSVPLDVLMEAATSVP